MIRLHEVRKVYPTRFGENLVLDDIGFDLAKGERLGILGRNGAGKSTLVRLVSGAEKPTSGTVERHMSVSWPLAFGGAFQYMLTGQDNVSFISRIYGQDIAPNLEFVEDFAELGAYIKEPIRTYSSGMRARLAFAISMIIEFDCFLIDEIAAVGDARFQARCNFELFEKRGDRAMSIISHDAGYIRDHCTRWAILEKGKFVEYDDFDLAYSDYKEIIGVSNRAAAARDSRSIALVARDRLRLLEFSHRTALNDDRFKALIHEADWARDRADWSHQAEDWEATEALYADALALFPFERSYWIQHGHAVKEQGDLARAEISYRTACALGLPAQEVAAHLHFVMQHQEVSEEDFPVRTFNPGKLPDQLPGKPDIDLLGHILWNVDAIQHNVMLDLLRRNRCFDELIAEMIGSLRFAGVSALDQAFHQSAVGGAASKDSERTLPWLEYVLATYLPTVRGGDRMTLLGQITSAEQVLPCLIQKGAFKDWELTPKALQRRSTEPNDIATGES